MRKKAILGMLVAALALGWNTRADEGKPAGKGPAADAQRIEQLIKQLGSNKFVERQNAKKELEALGMAALDALRRATKSEDLETRCRAVELVQKLDAKLLNDAMLAPKRVRLNLKDTPVLDAVAELQKQSGYPIQVMGDRSGLADKKITLDTGNTTFWEALDQLCRAAGLAEVQSPLPQVDRAFPAFPVQPLPRQIRPAIPLPPAPQAPGILPVVPPKAPVIPQLLQAAPLPAAQVGPVQVKPLPQPKVQLVRPQPPAVQLVPPPLELLGGQASRGPIALTVGKHRDVPTSYAGAVRIRLAPIQVAAAAGEYAVALEVNAEPRLQNFRILGSPRIDKAIDDQDQSLMIAMDPNAAVADPNQAIGAAGGNVIILGGAAPADIGGPRIVSVRFKRGDKPAKSLKELSGSINAQALAETEALVTIDQILKAAGKSAKAKDGGSLQVQSVEKLANGDIQVKVAMENLGGQNPFGGIGGRVVIQGGGAIQIRQVQIGGNGVMIQGMGGQQGNLPKLLDAKGQAYQVVNVPNQSFQFNNGQTTNNLTIVYRPQAGQGEASQLVLYGQRTITFQVPFTLKNVPL